MRLLCLILALPVMTFLLSHSAAPETVEADAPETVEADAPETVEAKILAQVGPADFVRQVSTLNKLEAGYREALQGFQEVVKSIYEKQDGFIVLTPAAASMGDDCKASFRDLKQLKLDDSSSGESEAAAQAASTPRLKFKKRPHFYLVAKELYQLCDQNYALQIYLPGELQVGFMRLMIKASVLKGYNKMVETMKSWEADPELADVVTPPSLVKTVDCLKRFLNNTVVRNAGSPDQAGEVLLGGALRMHSLSEQLAQLNTFFSTEKQQISTYAEQGLNLLKLVQSIASEESADMPAVSGYTDADITVLREIFQKRQINGALYKDLKVTDETVAHSHSELMRVLFNALKDNATLPQGLQGFCTAFQSIENNPIKLHTISVQLASSLANDWLTLILSTLTELSEQLTQQLETSQAANLASIIKQLSDMTLSDASQTAGAMSSGQPHLQDQLMNIVRNQVRVSLMARNQQQHLSNLQSVFLALGAQGMKVFQKSFDSFQNWKENMVTALQNLQTELEQEEVGAAASAEN